MSSIDHDAERETAEPSADQTEIDVDASSEIDRNTTLTPETVNKDAPEGPHHARSNSVKKPITFKAVSVTKNFLAKAGSVTTPTNKGNGDKPPSTAANSGNTVSQAPRPRLVAKSASGHQTSAPKLMNSLAKNGTGAGPDPNQVWNRNRPAPPTAPKQFTDEELKQQYGIHLATRLQADGDGKEAKWADIDDDEDDWVPETIEWNDGTKVNLAHTDSATVLAEEEAAAAAAAKEEEEAKKAKLPSPKPTTSVGPNATVLRLGSNLQARTGGLVLKTPSEKPTLVAKPSAPTPVRSPWAPLPPVDKVPPVPINPPSLNTGSRYQQTDTHGTDSVMTPSSTTMEIPADSFTRTRRDTQNGSHGQLYNSQSGQYETVNAPRRGSIRKEQNFRPPSLLQRPSPNDQPSPAEPSSAFQTHRSGVQQDNSLWNRRASSTVSDESGPQGRRASISKNADTPRTPLEPLHQRQDSQPLQSPSSSSHVQGRSAYVDIHGTHNQGSQPVQSGANLQQLPDNNAVSLSTQQTQTVLPNNAAASHTVSDIVAQKQLMREKRELAIKRKKEEEEREEFEKRERIRIRMEKMGLPPLVEKKETEKVTRGEILSEAKQAEEKRVEFRTVKVNDAAVQSSEVKSQDVATPAPRSPPKPPVPDSSGAPMQYGLMKVHGPTTGLHLSKGRVIENRSKPITSVEQTAPVEHNRRIDQHAPVQQNVPVIQEKSILHESVSEPTPVSPVINGEASGKDEEFFIPALPNSDDNRNIAQNVNRHEIKQDHKIDGRTNNKNDNTNPEFFKGSRQQSSWKSIQNDSDGFAGWNGAGMTTHSLPGGNLWGPPTNFKSLGNGTFDRGISRPQSRPLTYQENYHPSQQPQPIGPPKHLPRTRDSAEPTQAAEHGASVVAEDIQTIPTFPSSEIPPSHLATLSDNPIPTSTIPTSKMNKANSPPQPTPPVQAKPVINKDPYVHGQQTRATLAAWSNFHVTSAKEDQEKRRQAAHEESLRHAEEERTGIRRQLELPPMTETWRQVKLDDHEGRRQVIGVTKKLSSAAPGEQVNEDTVNTAYSQPANLIAPTGTVRGSRFFPTISRDLAIQETRVVSLTTGQSRLASPPPPESGNHPAYIREQQRPLVNLPFSKPKPTVRLPPLAATVIHSPVMPSLQTVPLRAISQPLVNNPSWQDRFNGLLGVKKAQPEKKPVHIADFSATKVPLDVPAVQISAPVSLPPREKSASRLKYDAGVTSKATEDEEALFENREFGSLPTVLIPAKAPESVQQSLKAGRTGKNPNVRLERHKEIDSETVKNLEDRPIEVSNGVVIFVKMAGMDEQKSKTMPRVKANNFNLSTQRNRHVSSGSKPGKGFKPRDGNGNFNPKLGPSGAQRVAMPNGVIPPPRSQFPKPNSHWNTAPRVANAV